MNPDGPLTIGFLGRVPPVLGGGGLELQMERTAAGLEGLGHRVLVVEAAGEDDAFDLLHAFGSEPAVWHYLRHWRRNPAPMVVTAVVVVSPGAGELALRISARIPALWTSSRMRRDVLRRADAVIAGTEYERTLVTRGLGLDAAAVTVIGNGAEPADPGVSPPAGMPEEYALLVGAVTARKRQRDVLAVLAGRVPVVVAGAYAGDPARRDDWERVVKESGATWLGEVDDRSTLAAIARDALALVHLSEAEVQSLAVLEALANATPVVLSDIPGHRELARAHPGYVRLVSGPADVPGAIEAIRARPAGDAPAIPTWTDVAGGLDGVYRRVLQGVR